MDSTSPVVCHQLATNHLNSNQPPHCASNQVVKSGEVAQFWWFSTDSQQVSSKRPFILQKSNPCTWTRSSNLMFCNGLNPAKSEWLLGSSDILLNINNCWISQLKDNLWQSIALCQVWLARKQSAVQSLLTPSVEPLTTESPQQSPQGI